MQVEFLSYISLFPTHCRSTSWHLTLPRRRVRGQLYLFSFLSEWHVDFAWIIRKFIYYFWISVNSLGYPLVHIAFNHLSFESDSSGLLYFRTFLLYYIFEKNFFYSMCSSLLSQEQLLKNWIHCLFFLLLFSV